MNTKILFLSLISGLSTVIGCIILLIGNKYKNKVLSFSFGLAGSVMLLISVLELVPEAISYSINIMSIPILFIVSLLIMVSGGVVVNLLDKYSNKENELYNIGWLCMLSILIHNIPEGICISLPIYYATKSRGKAFLYTIISSLGEILGAVITMLFFYKYLLLLMDLILLPSILILKLYLLQNMDFLLLLLLI